VSVSAVVQSFLVSPHQAPRLLVSVRNPNEARAAIAGGCDILDIKEPNRGSLGMADPAIAAEIVAAVKKISPGLPVSAALGEVVEWQAAVVQSGVVQAEKSSKHSGLSLPADCTFLKIGCAGLRSQAEWRSLLNATRAAVAATIQETPQWVAVAYADWEAADAPCVSDVVDAALQDNCCGILIDTFTKSDRWLLDWITLDELQGIAVRVHSRGLFLAVAGSLNLAGRSRLRSVAVDVLAIRGAACIQGQRKSEVSESAVREFQQQIATTWK
jgi:uncharacterized protein (UPF0264 family)